MLSVFIQNTPLIIYYSAGDFHKKIDIFFVDIIKNIYKKLLDELCQNVFLSTLTFENDQKSLYVKLCKYTLQ